MNWQWQVTYISTSARQTGTSEVILDKRLAWHALLHPKSSQCLGLSLASLLPLLFAQRLDGRTDQPELQAKRNIYLY